MSKKKSARRSSNKNRTRNNVFGNFLGAVKLRILYLVTVVISFVTVQAVNYVKNSVVWGVMVGKRDSNGGGGDEDQGMSDRKRARIANKQSKMVAEWRLVVKKGLEEEDGGGEREEDSAAGGKKMKLEGEGERKKLGEEEFKAMKKELAERKRALMHLPRFWINSTTGTSASVFLTPYDKRTPLLLSDLEHLVTYAYGGNQLVPPPSRWCSLQKPNRLNNIVVVVVDGVGLSEFVDHEECFSGCMQVFGGDGGNRAIVEFLSPSWYGVSLEKEIRDWGVIGGNQRAVNNVQQPTDPEDIDTQPTTVENFQNVLNQLRSVFPISTEPETTLSEELPPTDKFSRTNLILTLPQLIQEIYPMPIPSTALSKITFVPTAECYAPVSATSKMFSLDCEMCSTAEDPQALTKVAIVDEELTTVYETLVKPEGEIIDYLTKWSGITKEMLDGVEVTLGDVQERIRGIVNEHPGCIFVGQSLNCDLKAVRMTHPYVIDTSVIFNLCGVEGRKSSLRDLAFNLIDEEIQVEVQDKKKKQAVKGHDPVEDASAAMKLVKTKLEKGFTFGNALKNPSFLRQSTKLSLDRSFTSSSFKQTKLDKNVLLVYQSPESEPPSDDQPQKEETPQKTEQTTTTTTTNPQPHSSSKTPVPHLVTRLETDSNGNTIKNVSTRIYEYYLSIGFYNIKPDCQDLKKSLRKLDKRISKLYGNLGGNGVFLVVCSKACGEVSGGGVGMSSDVVRRNNGVAFFRLKVNEVARRRD